MPTSPPSPTPNYGLDAPGAVRNLFIASALGLLTFLSIKLHLWSGVLVLGPIHARLGPMSISLGVISGVMGAWMALDSKYGKIHERERLLNLLTWTGGWHASPPPAPSIPNAVWHASGSAEACSSTAIPKRPAYFFPPRH